MDVAFKCNCSRTVFKDFTWEENTVNYSLGDMTLLDAEPTEKIVTELLDCKENAIYEKSDFEGKIVVFDGAFTSINEKFQKVIICIMKSFLIFWMRKKH